MRVGGEVSPGVPTPLELAVSGCRRAHTLTVLFILTCALGYVTLLEETPQDTAYNTKR